MEKIDQLAEFYSQRDSVELQKQLLLGEVKIPQEVQDIVSAGMKRMGEVESEFRLEAKKLDAELEAELKAVVVPDEIKSALAEIDSKRAAIQAKRTARSNEVQKQIQARKAEIQATTEAQTKSVYDAIAQRKRDIEIEFSGKIEDVNRNIADLENEIKNETKALGQTVKGQYLMAVYVKGRVSWNNDMLDGMIALVPQLKQARKEGEPSVSIRRI